MTTPTQTLTRVRNNQRRHRQRRRDYIASLEQRLKDAEERLAQVQIENAALRSRIKSTSHSGQETYDTASLTISETNMISHDISTASSVSQEIRHYLPDARGADPGSAPVTSIAVLQPDFPSQDMESEAYERTVIGDIPPFLFSPNLPIPVSTELTPCTTNLTSPSDVHLRPACCSSTSLEPSPFNQVQDTSWLGNQTSAHRLSMFLSASFSTLCSHAYFIIQHHNRRQLPMDAVERWLWPGFIDSDPSNENGCRVDNQLLLGLLEYIT